MNEVEKYLQKVSAGLYRLPESERNEILGEIRNHIYEAESRQEPVQAVLNKLGSPLNLAQSYVNIHNIESGDISFGSIFNGMAFYISAGFSGIFIVPTLFTATFAFLLAAVVFVGYSIIDLFMDLPGGIGFDISATHMNFGLVISGFASDSAVVFTGFTAVGVALIIAIFCFGIAWLCWKGLKKYLSFISHRYQKLRILNKAN